MRKLLKIFFFLSVTSFLFLVALFFVHGWVDERYKSGNVTSGSMLPTLKIGDLIYTALGQSPQIGDIVLFRCHNECANGSEDSFITHRLTAIHPDGCMEITGDNQPSAWDTNDYGCLMPEDIEIYGVTYKLDSVKPKTFKAFFANLYILADVFHRNN